MDAVLAIIANGRQVIIVFNREGVEIYHFLLFSLILLKPFYSDLVQPLSKRHPGVGYVPPSKPWRWRGKRLHHGEDVCVLVFS